MANKWTLLQISILIGWISCCFPISLKYLNIPTKKKVIASPENITNHSCRNRKSSQPTNGHKQQRLRHPMFYIASILLIIKIAFNIYYVVIPMIEIAETSLSTFIISTVSVICWILSDFIQRTFFLMNSSLIEKTFKKFNKLEILLTKMPLLDNKIFYLTILNFVLTLSRGIIDTVYNWVHYSDLTSGSVITIIFIGFTGLELAANISSTGLIILMGQKLKCYYIQIVLNEFLLQEAECNLVITKDHDNNNHDDLEELVNRQPKLKLIIMEEFKDVHVQTSTAEVKANKQKHCPSNNNNFEEVIYNKFRKLQQCFSLYGQLVGIISAVALFQSSVLSVFYMFLLIINHLAYDGYWKLLPFLGAIEEYSNLYLIALTGQELANTMQSTKEKLKSTLFSCTTKNVREFTEGSQQKNHNINSRRYLIAKFILEWDWEFTAASLFNIDSKLIPMVAGISMTYLMFIFQILISEKTTV